MKKMLLGLLIMGTISFIWGATSTTAAPKPVVFKAVAFEPKGSLDNYGFELFIKEVNEKFKNEIFINYVGGPEVVPPFELHEAVRSGVIDICVTSSGYYPAVVPEAYSIMFSTKTPQEVSQTGFEDLMIELHKKAGIIWLGRGSYGITFHLFTNVQVEKLNDLKGKKIRTFPALNPFVNALGGVPISLPVGEIYVAMERGAVDGFIINHHGVVKDYSYHEVTKYVIEPGIYEGVLYILANPKTWNRLSTGQKARLLDFKKNHIDPKVAAYWEKANKELWQLMIDKGIKVIELSSSDAKKYLQAAYESPWATIIKKSPDLGPKIKMMLIK